MQISSALRDWDAPGVSGQYAAYRNDINLAELNLNAIDIGHPWTVFAGGPGEVGGAVTTSDAYANHIAEINSTVLLCPTWTQSTGLRWPCVAGPTTLRTWFRRHI